MSRNSSSDRAWSILFSERCVFSSISNVRLRRLSQGSMNERQRPFSLLMSLSPPSSRLFSALSVFSAVIRWFSHYAEFQQYLHPRLCYLQPSEFKAEVRFCDSSWMTCLISRALRSSCIFRQHYPLLITLGWGMGCLLVMVDRSWCKTCQRQPLQKKFASESCEREDSGNRWLS